MADDPTARGPRWHEADRLAALRGLGVLDTPAEEAFDDIVALIQAICEVPVALVSLVEADRQWFKAKVGVDVTQTGIETSVCALAIRQGGVFVIEDLAADPRTADFEIVRAAPHIRFYAGAPLVTSDGLPLGMLCAIDVAPRPQGLTSRQRIALEALARETVAKIEARVRLDEQRERTQAARTREDLGPLEMMVRAQQRVLAAGGAVEQVMQALVESALQALPASDGVVVEVRDGEEMVYCHAAGTAAAEIGLRLPLHGSMSGRALLQGRTILTGDALREPSAHRGLVERLGMRSLLVVPLFRQRQPFGVLKLHAGAVDAFGSREVLIAQLLSGLIANGFAEGDEAFMLALDDALRGGEEADGLRAAMGIVGAHFGCPLAGYGELADGRIELKVGWGDDAQPPLLGIMPATALGRGILAAIEAGDPFACDDRGEASGLVRAALAVPLGGKAHPRRFLYLASTVARRWAAADIALMEKIAERTRQAVERRDAEAQLRSSEAYWRNLFQQLDEAFYVAEAVRDEAGALTDWRYVQANRAFRTLIDAGTASLVGRSARAIDPFFSPEACARIATLLKTGETASFYQARGDAWYHGRAFALGDDRFGILFGDATEARRETRRREALLALGDRIDEAGDPAEIVYAACGLLARTLDVDRVGYGEIDTASETILIERDHNASGVASIAGTLQFRDYGSYIEDLKRGETVAIEDVRLDPRTADGAAALEAIAARSFVNMPVTEQGDAVALFFVNHGQPRAWAADLPLIREFAERIRTAVERRRAERRLAALTASLEQEVEQRTAALMVAEEQLRQSQKMEAVGQLTGGLAHDFNNMLTGIAGALEMIQVRVTQGRTAELERYVSAAQGAARRAAALTHRLLAFSRRQTLDPKPTDVNRLIRGIEDLIRRTVGPRIEVEVVGLAGIWSALVDPNQLENALLNLCINARDAMPNGGRITIETANKWLDPRAAAERNLVEGQFLSLCVTDTGTGMPPEVAARAFDPFFTTKPLGEGTGLGLSMIYGFARQSEGQVRIYSEVGEGTTVCIYLPRFLGEADEADLPPERRTIAAPPSGKTVLVVDDEPTIRMLVAEVLQDLGYAAIEAGDGQVALKVLGSDAVIDLLITDVGLPGSLNGRQVADAARVLRPDLKILFITGYAENAVIGNGRLDPGMELVTKPFAMEALGEKIRVLLAG